jgi:hypothetical protein
VEAFPGGLAERRDVCRVQRRGLIGAGPHRYLDEVKASRLVVCLPVTATEDVALELRAK